MTTFDWIFAAIDVVLVGVTGVVFYLIDRRIKRLAREGKLRAPKG